MPWAVLPGVWIPRIPRPPFLRVKLQAALKDILRLGGSQNTTQVCRASNREQAAEGLDGWRLPGARPAAFPRAAPAWERPACERPARVPGGSHPQPGERDCTVTLTPCINFPAHRGLASGDHQLIEPWVQAAVCPGLAQPSEPGCPRSWIFLPSPFCSPLFLLPGILSEGF